MRSVAVAVLSLVALAGCATPDTKAPATAVSADAQQDAAPSAAKKPRNCIVGTRLCTHEQEVDPSVTGMSGQALGDARRGHEVGGLINP